MGWANELTRWLALAFGLAVCVVITAASFERQKQRHREGEKR